MVLISFLLFFFKTFKSPFSFFKRIKNLVLLNIYNISGNFWKFNFEESCESSNWIFIRIHIHSFFVQSPEPLLELVNLILAIIVIGINYAAVDGRIWLCTVNVVYGAGVVLILAIIVIGINYAAVDGRIILLVEVKNGQLQEFIRYSIRLQFRPPLSTPKIQFWYSIDIL